MIAAVLGATAIVAPVVLAPAASAHGWVTSPPSRQDSCATGAVSFDCGGLAYEPQSVEAPHGSLQCSGGSAYAILDDDSKPWPRTTVASSVKFQWKLTANHSTSTWEYFVDGKLHQTFSQGGAQPPKDISHTLTNLPAGNHTVLARWNVSDTVNSFYNCVDLTVTGGGATGVDPTGTDPTGTDPRERTRRAPTPRVARRVAQPAERRASAPRRPGTPAPSTRVVPGSRSTASCSRPSGGPRATSLTPPHSGALEEPRRLLRSDSRRVRREP
ncbi:lytic polysaccharide monooxygenase [Oerskovia sp. M15]